VKVRKFDFTFQFFWKPVPLTQRLEEKRKAEAEAKALEEAGGTGEQTPVEGDSVAQR